MASAVTVALALDAAVTVSVVWRSFKSICLVGENSSTSYTVLMPLPYRKGLPDMFRNVTPPALKMLKHPALSRWPMEMKLWDRSGQW